jgi:hypothetical protein
MKNGADEHFIEYVKQGIELQKRKHLPVKGVYLYRLPFLTYRQHAQRH